MWNLTNCKLKTNHFGHRGYLNCVTVSPDGSLCASGGKVTWALVYILHNCFQAVSSHCNRCLLKYTTPKTHISAVQLMMQWTRQICNCRYTGSPEMAAAGSEYKVLSRLAGANYHSRFKSERKFSLILIAVDVVDCRERPIIFWGGHLESGTYPPSLHRINFPRIWQVH